MITIIKLYKQVFGMKIYLYVKCFDWYHLYNKNKQSPWNIYFNEQCLRQGWKYLYLH